jgi:hypothetical protein
MTPQAAALLAELFEGRNPSASLNKALGLPPWWPSLVTVWRHIDDPPPTGLHGRAAYWPDAVALLRRLHAEYLDANPEVDHDD